MKFEDFQKAIKKIPDIPIIGDKHWWGNLFRMKSREYDFRTCWIEISFYYGDAARKFRIGTWSIWRDVFFDWFYRRILIVWDFHLSRIRCRSIRIFHRYHILYVWTWRFVDISCNWSKSISMSRIPIRRSHWKWGSWLLRFDLFFLWSIRWKFIHRNIYREKYEKCTECANPFMETLSPWNPGRRRFHTFTKRAK